MSYQGAGIYKHYKGGFYAVLGLSVDEETKPEPEPASEGGDENWDGVQTRVVYVPLSSGSLLPGPLGQMMWTRKLEDFNATVTIIHPQRSPSPVPRFVKIA
jgi:hypothetical protein